MYIYIYTHEVEFTILVTSIQVVLHLDSTVTWLMKV